MQGFDDYITHDWREDDEFYEYFVCSLCKEKDDDPEIYMHRISDLVNPEEPNQEFWICKECYLDELNDKFIEDELF